MLVQKHELRINSGFERVLSQQSRAKTMDRRDDPAVQGPFVVNPGGPLLRRCCTDDSLELPSQPLAHLIRSPIGKSDGYDLVNGDASSAQNLEITLDQHRRFARAGTRGDRHVTIERRCSFPLMFIQLAFQWFVI
jgi:hypothetical protein